MHTKIWLKNLKEGDHLEDLGIDGRVNLREIMWEGMDGNFLAC
jgi:hypothetical protein